MEQGSRGPALLPVGLRDVLPPDAAFEAAVMERMLGLVETHGYERIRPPLVEFTETLLAGPGAALADVLFRTTDPQGDGRMLAVRPDFTVQAARIATTRLARRPRPLRLVCGGSSLRARGDTLEGRRQLLQVGFEVFGADTPHADAEVITLAVAALEAAGLTGVSVDVTLPTLVPAILAAHALPAEALAPLRHALDHKDRAVVAAEGGAATDVLLALLDAEGPAARARTALETLALPASAAPAVAGLARVLALLAERRPDLAVTVDLTERRGLEYHTGVCFSLFIPGAEVGRGGRYLAAGDEPATGATLDLDGVTGALGAPAPRRRLFVPLSRLAEGDQWRAEGYVTVAALGPDEDPAAEAVHLGCGHWLPAEGGPPRAVREE